MVVTIKLLNNKLSNIMKKNLLKIMEDVTVGILQSRNFGNLSMLFLVTHNLIFGVGYYNRKNDTFAFMDILFLILFSKNPEEKRLSNNLAKFLFITSW